MKRQCKMSLEFCIKKQELSLANKDSAHFKQATKSSKTKSHLKFENANHILSFKHLAAMGLHKMIHSSTIKLKYQFDHIYAIHWQQLNNLAFRHKSFWTSRSDMQKSINRIICSVEHCILQLPTSVSVSINSEPTA